MVKIAIPANVYVKDEDAEKLEDLFRLFGIARRRAYNLIWKSRRRVQKGIEEKEITQYEIEKIIQKQTGLMQDMSRMRSTP